MNSDFQSFKVRRSRFINGFCVIGEDSILEIPIAGAELLPSSVLDEIAEISEATLNETIAQWKRIAKDTEFEEILNAELE